MIGQVSIGKRHVGPVHRDLHPGVRLATARRHGRLADRVSARPGGVGAAVLERGPRGGGDPGAGPRRRLGGRGQRRRGGPAARRQAGAPHRARAGGAAGRRPGVRRHRRAAAAARAQCRDVPVAGADQLAVAAVAGRIENHRHHLQLPARLVGAADQLGGVQGAGQPPQPADAGARGDVRCRGDAGRLPRGAVGARKAVGIPAARHAGARRRPATRRLRAASIAARTRARRGSATCA